MKLTFKTILSIFIFQLSLFTLTAYSQNTSYSLTLSKLSNERKVKHIDQNTFFKVKTLDGKKLKGKFASVSENYFTTASNDTIYINNIDWIKARKQLTKWEKGLSIAGVFGGTIYSYASVMATLMIIAMEANYWIILAPAIIIPATVISFRTLVGRRYKMRRWKLETHSTIN